MATGIVCQTFVGYFGLFRVYITGAPFQMMQAERNRQLKFAKNRLTYWHICSIQNTGDSGSEARETYIPSKVTIDPVRSTSAMQDRIL